MAKKSMFKIKIKKEMNEDIRMYSNFVKCEKCGHSIDLKGKEKQLCIFCGRYIFRDKQEEFKYRMRGLI